MTARRQIALALVIVAARAGAQTSAASFATAADRALLERIIAAEDARGPDLAVIRQGTASSNPALRAFAVRSLGRMERASAIDLIVPLLSDGAAHVRAAAATALAQAASHGGAERARATILERLGTERDDSVLSALAESLGRLAVADRASARVNADYLIRLSRVSGDTSAADAPRVVLRGVVRGLFFLSRRLESKGAFSAEAVRRLAQLAIGYRLSAIGNDEPAGGSTSAPTGNAAYIRMLAAATLVAEGAASSEDLDKILGDPDPSVREQALAGVQSIGDTAVVRRLTLRALSDSAPVVRFRAIPVYARWVRSTDCGPLMAAAHDTNSHVALAAIDALAVCRPDFPAARLLDSIAAELTPGTTHWHRSAHALVSLANAAPQAARIRLPAFLADSNFFVRTYAARAARRLPDANTLTKLAAATEHPNVRAEAIDGLAQLGGHSYDSVYVAALQSDASQLLQSAAKALSGSTDPRTLAALLDALDRVTKLQSETMRDARLALLATLATQPPSSAGRLLAFRVDYDSVVARRVSALYEKWTDRPLPISTARVLEAVPSFAELAAIEPTRATIEMEDGSQIVLRLFPFDAPTNVWTFVRLARRGYFDGLTFHRVVPWFVVQGGSPGANEYMGDGHFTDDELGLENRRGTVGVSTRGRDTGDGQLYFNLIDNVRLDHDYTVWGEVVSRMDAVDRMEEGALIRRVTIR